MASSLDVVAARIKVGQFLYVAIGAEIEGDYEDHVELLAQGVMALLVREGWRGPERKTKR